VKRRDFITLLGCAPAWPVAAPAQPAMPVIGYLGSFAPTGTFLAAFRKGLADSGYVEGRNVAIDYVTDSQYDRLPIIAADFARRQVALIVAVSTPPGTRRESCHAQYPDRVQHPR
jgi:putative ABC transport system substrate-binding protein